MIKCLILWFVGMFLYGGKIQKVKGFWWIDFIVFGQVQFVVFDMVKCECDIGKMVKIMKMIVIVVLLMFKI